MTTYADRFAAAMAPLLPDDVTVTNAQGLIVIERGTARVTVSPAENTDRRAAVSLDQARAAIEGAARKLSGEIPKYRDQFKAPAAELAAIFRAASELTGTGAYGGGQCRYVLDGLAADGTPWHRCTVHDSVEISPDAPCEVAP